MNSPVLLTVILLLIFPGWLPAQVAEKSKPVKLELVGGDTISGSVSSVKDGSVSVITEYGVIRVPVAKLTEGSRKQLGLTAESSTAALQKRVVELEALVESLREENAELRRRQATTPPSPQPLITRPARGATTTSPTDQPTSAGKVWISSTGKAHNGGCRYYGVGKGRYANSGQGVACKICGG